MLCDHPRTNLQRRPSAFQAEPFDPCLPFRVQSLGRLELDPMADIQLYDLRTGNVFLNVRSVRRGRARRVAQRSDPQCRLAYGPGFLRDLYIYVRQWSDGESKRRMNSTSERTLVIRKVQVVDGHFVKVQQ